MTVSSVTGRHRGGHTRSQQRAWASRFAAGLPCRARYAVSTLRAGIPLAFARVRSLRAPLATNKEGEPLPTKALPVVMSDCVTRAHDSNPAGPSLRYGLAQEALRRAVKVADREVRLPETTSGGVCRAPALSAGRRVGPALVDAASRSAALSAVPGRTDMQRFNILVLGQGGAPGGFNAYWNRAPQHGGAPGLPRLHQRELPHRHRRLSAPTPA